MERWAHRVLLYSMLFGAGPWFGPTAESWGAGAQRPPLEKASAWIPLVDLESIDELEVALPRIPGEKSQKMSFGVALCRRVVALTQGRLRWKLPQQCRESQLDSRLASSTSASVSVAVGPTFLADPLRVPEEPVVSQKLRWDFKEVSFQSGDRSERSFYGYNQRIRHPFVASQELDAIAEPFGPTFRDTGDLHVGKDLGSQFNLDLLLFSARWNWQDFSTRMGVLVRLQSEVSNEPAQEKIYRSESRGRFLSFGMNFMEWSLSTSLSQRDAWVKSFDGLARWMAETLYADVSKREMVLRSFYVWKGADSDPSVSALFRYKPGVFVSPGSMDGGVLPGQIFYNWSAYRRGESESPWIVLHAFARSCHLVPLLREPLAVERAQFGDVFSQIRPPRGSDQGVASMTSQASRSSSEDEVSFQSNSMSISPSSAESVRESNWFQRMGQGIVDFVTLPYRVARWFQYDQAYDGAGLHEDLDWNYLYSRARQKWHLQQIGVFPLWHRTRGDPRVIVGLLGSGVAYNHPDLRRRIYFDGIGGAPGYDFFSGDSRPYDDHAHGTAVASAIVGVGQDWVGVAPDLTILPLKVTGSFGQTTDGALVAGVEYALQQRVRILVLPGQVILPSQGLRWSLERALSSGVLLVVASGDEGVDLDREDRYPTAWIRQLPERLKQRVVVVAGTDSRRRIFHRALSGSLSLSSNFGENSVDIAAPAAYIQVAGPRGGHQLVSYTGVASGLVAGAAGLLFSLHPQWSAEEVRHELLLKASVRDELLGHVGGGRFLDLSKIGQE